MFLLKPLSRIVVQGLRRPACRADNPGSNDSAVGRSCDGRVEKAFRHAMHRVPEATTALLSARVPCLLLIARSASGDLDRLTLGVVDRIQSQIPALVTVHCSVIARKCPHERQTAVEEMVGDLQMIAQLAQARLDLLMVQRIGQRHPPVAMAA